MKTLVVSLALLMWISIWLGLRALQMALVTITVIVAISCLKTVTDNCGTTWTVDKYVNTNLFCPEKK
jgi:hypothetical protein